MKLYLILTKHLRLMQQTFLFSFQCKFYIRNSLIYITKYLMCDKTLVPFLCYRQIIIVEINFYNQNTNKIISIYIILYIQRNYQTHNIMWLEYTKYNYKLNWSGTTLKFAHTLYLYMSSLTYFLNSSMRYYNSTSYFCY